MLLLFAGMAHAQEAVYVVTHIDVTGPNALPAAALLKQFAADSAKEKGCVRIEVLVQEDRNNHFTLVGVWKDKKAFEDHDAAAYTKTFREKLQPMVGSPWDERLHYLTKP